MSVKQKSVLLVLLLLPLAVVADELAAFTTDGCSAFPDGTLIEKQLWLACCTEHDYAYWQGGTVQQRLDADVQLEQCVTVVGEPRIAALMLAGVRVGGVPYLPTPFRWGYGWPYPGRYRALSEQELLQVEVMRPH